MSTDTLTPTYLFQLGLEIALVSFFFNFFLKMFYRKNTFVIMSFFLLKLILSFCNISSSTSMNLYISDIFIHVPRNKHFTDFSSFKTIIKLNSSFFYFIFTLQNVRCILKERCGFYVHNMSIVQYTQYMVIKADRCFHMSLLLDG